VTTPTENGPPNVPLRETRLLGALVRVADLGSTAQASVTGIYAWSVSVAPAAFAHGAPGIAQMAAVFGIASLAGAPILESKRPRAARIVSVWGLVFTSLLVWIAVPSSSLSPLRFDGVRGLAGMLGWALFAFASAAPALVPLSSESATWTLSRALRSRSPTGWADAAILWIGIGMAGVTQAVGWHVVEPERAVLVRLLGLVGGLAMVGAAASMVAARHVARKFDAPARRARRAVVSLVMLGLLAAVGVAFALTPRP
jgi:hypothetical protein